MKKSFLLVSAVLLGTASCTEEIIVENGDNISGTTELTFSALSEKRESNGMTRTLIREGNQTLWISNDRISLFASETSNNPFITKDGGIVADFKGTVSQTADTYYALYPYNSQAKFEASTSTFTTVLYAQQYAEPDSYASGMNVAIAKSSQSDAQNLNFANAASYLRVEIPESYSGDPIYAMELSGNNGELIAGDITTSAVSNATAPAVVIDNKNASNTIYLNQINQGDVCISGKSYYFVLAPTDMTAGYTLRLTNGAGKTATVTGEPTNFQRNHVYTVTLDNSLSFEGDDCGETTTDGLMKITNLDCLYTWAQRVAEGEPSLGCYLMADIDFREDTQNRVWPQIGTEDTPFVGTVRGNGKTISNFSISGSNQYTGFVAVLGDGGYVENVTFDSPILSSDYTGASSSVTDDGFVGVVAARINEQHQFNYDKGTITNCAVINPTVSGGENVGGIVGRSYGRNDAIANCTVSGGTIQGHMFVGGIIGNAEGIIENCHVKNNTSISYHDVETEARVGGIVGTNNSGQLVACTAYATVEGNQASGLDARYAGGVAGANNGTMIGCAFSGSVSGDYSGALAGESYGDMYGCYAQNATAAALIYKVKSNTNKEEDVIGPTFKACYLVGTGEIIGSGSLRDYTLENCTTVSAINQVSQTMNSALNEVNSNGDYAYGAGYQYEKNSGDDASIFPVKATKPQ